MENWNLEKFGPCPKKIFRGDYALGMHFKVCTWYALRICTWELLSAYAFDYAYALVDYKLNITIRKNIMIVIIAII